MKVEFLYYILILFTKYVGTYSITLTKFCHKFEENCIITQ